MAIVRYLVNDIDESLTFYEALGLVLVSRWGPPFAMLKMDDLDLWLSAPGTSATKPLPDGRKPCGGGGWCRIVLPVESIDAVLSSSPALQAAMSGTPVTGPGGTHVLLADPSGNLVELFQS